MNQDERIQTRFTTEQCANCGYRAAFASLCNYKGQRMCYACTRRAQGNAVYEKHHILGRDYPYTVALPANMHRDLTVMQNQWPPVLKHPDNPLLLFAVVLRIVADLAVWSATWLGMQCDRVSDWLVAHYLDLEERLPGWQQNLAPIGRLI
jgi:hypothetical protein